MRSRPAESILVVATLILVLAAAVGCTGSKVRYRDVRVPPPVDLAQLDVIAVVEFEANRAGTLGSLATRRFTDLARRDQGLVRMLSVERGAARREGSAIRELGERLGAQTVLVGTIHVSDVHPNVSLYEGGDISFDAEDPEHAYGPLVDALVPQVTSDSRASWIRERVVVPGD